MDWRVQIGTLKMRVSPYLVAYRCHRDTHHALQVQIHGKTPRVDLMEQVRKLKMRVSPCPKLPDSLSYDWLPSGYSSDFAGTNVQNDASSGLHGTNPENKDEG